jgi:hypothetical protein
MSKRTELSNRVEHLWDKLFHRISEPQVPYHPEYTDNKTNSIFRTNPILDPITVPPWDPWEIDPKFVKALSKWDRDNPENTLERVFDKINTGLENAQPLFDLIPDSPFPARGLVTALAHLVKLGLVCQSSFIYLLFIITTNLCRKSLEQSQRCSSLPRKSFSGLPRWPWRSRRAESTLAFSARKQRGISRNEGM